MKPARGEVLRVLRLSWRFRVCFQVLILAVFTRGVTADDPSETAKGALKRVKLPVQGALVLPVPAGWEINSAKQQNERVIHLQFGLEYASGPTAGTSLHVEVDVIQGLPEEQRTDPKILKMVQRSRDLFAPKYTSRRNPIRPFQAGETRGYYFSGYDTALPGDEHRYLSMGSAVVEDLLIHFSVTSKDVTEPETAATIEMIKGARRERPN